MASHAMPMISIKVFCIDSLFLWYTIYTNEARDRVVKYPKATMSAIMKGGGYRKLKEIKRKEERERERERERDVIQEPT